jgi:hypothetical protein
MTNDIVTNEDHARYILLCTGFAFNRPGRSALFNWLWMSTQFAELGGFLPTYQLIAGLEHVPDDLLEVVAEDASHKYWYRNPVSLPALIEDCREAQAKLDRIHEINQLRRSMGLDENPQKEA